MPATKILLFIADPSLTHSITISLVQSGYRVLHISRGIGSLELIQVEHPALVILDSELPDYNSMAIIRALRTQEQDRHTPVILMGSNLKEEQVLIGLEVGADLCLAETFHPQVFIARLRSLLRRSELVKTC